MQPEYETSSDFQQDSTNQIQVMETCTMYYIITSYKCPYFF